LSGRLRLYLGQLALAQRHTVRFAQEHQAWFARMQRTLQPWLPDLAGLRVLDVGCGLLQWQTILLHSLGAHTSGVDMEYVRGDRRPDKYLHIWRSNGLERAVKTLFWDLVYRGRYRAALAASAAFPLRFDGLDLRQHTAERLPFADASFDLVASHEVFEHIPDIAAAAREVRRVLKPGGIAYINVHLYPSISGGHHVEWKYPDETPSLRVPPWDHLRQRQFAERPSWLNCLREPAYRAVFEQEFELLAWEPSAWEGRALLTADIRRELADYSEEELLKKGVIIVARKPAA
jgi:SAM-dependent methyltransferase